MKNKLQIQKKLNFKGDDGYKTFSRCTVKKLEEISKSTNRSRNELINLMLEFSIENCEIKD